MLWIYQICFTIGTLWTLLTFIFGEILDGVGDSDLDGLTFGHSWSTRSLLAAVTFFGIGGWILSIYNLSDITVLILAIVIGLFFGMGIEYGLLRPLRKAQSTSSISMEELKGLEAVVVESFSTAPLGRIKVAANGNTLFFPAKNINSVAHLSLHESVIIVEILDGVAIVSSNDSMQ